MASTDKRGIYLPYQLRQYDSVSKNTSLFDREEKSLSRAGKAGSRRTGLGSAQMARYLPGYSNIFCKSWYYRLLVIWHAANHLHREEKCNAQDQYDNSGAAHGCPWLVCYCLDGRK
jgi:hypothetical protein